MIALDTGDKIRADASVADKIDYTIHGMVDDDVCQLSDGQLAGAEADIYTAPSDAGIVSTLILVNTHNAAITCNIYLKPSGGTSRRIIPKDTSIGAGYSLQYDGIRLIVANEAGEVGAVTVVAQPADTFVAEGGALGKGVLLQGDDGTDRHNVAVNASGKILVTEQEAANIETHLDHIENRFQADGQAIDYGLLVQGNDGTDRHNLEMAANGDLKVTLDSEAVVLGAGSETVGKLAANSGVDIGDVDVISQPADIFVAENGTLGKGVLLQGDDGTDRKNVAVDVSGNVQVDVVGALPAGSAAIGKLAANSGVDIGDVDVASQPADIFVAEDGALGKGVLLQGDDGTDRKNVLVDTAGHLQVDVLSGGGGGTQYAEDAINEQPTGTVSLCKQRVAGAANDILIVPAVDASGNIQTDVVGALPSGSNAIGKLAANSGVDIGDVDILSLPALVAGAAKIGSVDVGDLTGTWTCIKVDISTATTTALKAGVAGHTFTVISISLTIAAENNLTWKSAANLLSGPMDFGASGEPHGWQANLWPCGLKCTTGETLNLTTSTTGQVSGFITVLDES